MGLIPSSSTPVCFSPRFSYFSDNFSSAQHLHWLQNFLPHGSCNTALKIINDLHAATYNDQFSVIILDLWATVITVMTTSSLIHPLQWTMQPLGSSPTSVVSLLLPPLLSPSECWISQGVSLWPSSCLHSLLTWSRPLPVVLNTNAMPPPESVYIQLQPFSWTLGWIQLPAWSLHFDVYEASQTHYIQNRTPGLPHLTSKSVFIISVNGDPILLAF